MDGFGATPDMQACLSRAKPVLEADGSMMMFCNQTIFVFRKGEDGAWRFVEIGADDECRVVPSSRTIASPLLLGRFTFEVHHV